MFRSQKIYQRSIFVTWCTANCKLQELNRTAVAKTYSIPFYFKIQLIAYKQVEEEENNVVSD